MKHPFSQGGAPREHPVSCVVCRERTCNHFARCDRHCFCFAPLTPGGDR
jgi:hypothetical protein